MTRKKCKKLKKSVPLENSNYVETSVVHIDVFKVKVSIWIMYA